MKPGYVYILTNPCIRYSYRENGIERSISPVKVGMTTRGLEDRLGALNTSLPENFVHHMSVYAQDPKAVENVVHRLLESKGYRINTQSGGSTEFFRCSVEEAVTVLRQTAKDMHLKEYKIRKEKLDGRSASNIKSNAKKKATGGRVSAPRGEAWKGKTQLAKLIARRGGNEGAFGGILQFFAEAGSKVRKPCHPGTKWRKPLEDAGVKFDSVDFVVDWEHAKNPL